MQDCFRFGNVRQEMANTFSIDVESGGLVTDDEGKLVWGFRIMHEAEDEISGAHVVREIGEEAVAERIVTQVLNCAAAIGVSVSLMDLCLCNGREAFQQDRPDLAFPGKINEY